MSTPRVNNFLGTLLVLIGLIILGAVIGSMLGLASINLFDSTQTGITVNNLSAFLENPVYQKEAWYPLITFQGINHLFTFLIPGLAYWALIERSTIIDFGFNTKLGPLYYLLVFSLVLLSGPIINNLSLWNQQMVLPESMASLEQGFKSAEEHAKKVTDFMVGFASPLQLLIAIFVIAVLPAIGEEVIFRGILQRKLAESSKNIHFAIWAAAAIFSAIHFQFYGFIPRMLLGAFFGYLYFWSGRLSVAILGHFVNNATVVILNWLENINLISTSVYDEAYLPLYIVAPSVVATILVAIYLKKQADYSKLFTNQQISTH